MQLDAHPLANIYPDMTPDEFAGLVDDIGRNGLQQSIVLHDGMILDGRHRFRAIMNLREHGSQIEPRFVPFEGVDPVAFVHSINFHRRHLNVTQRACIGLEYKKQFQQGIEHGGDRRSEDFQGDNNSTLKEDGEAKKAREKAARLVNVSPSVIDKVARVEREAPAMFDAMKDGGVSVWEAERELNSVADGNEPSQKLAPLMTSNSFEWYTPAAIIERVHLCLGSIDVDPCTSETANETVKAAEIFTQQTDGLQQEWRGRVFMNPPYGDVIGRWAEKLKAEHVSGRTTQALALLPARTDTAWFRVLKEYPRCFLHGRLKFGGPGENGNSATFPSVVVALGCDSVALAEAFDGLGDTYEPVRRAL